MRFTRIVGVPLWRFYLVIAATVLVLALSVNQLYQLFRGQNQPSVDARLVLDAVQQLRQDDKALSCHADGPEDCSDALFIIYPAGFWQSQQSDQVLASPAQVIPLADSEGQVQLCSVEASQELLCLNQLNWPRKQELQVELTYLFYLLLLLSLFFISRHLFRDIEVLRKSALTEIRHGHLPDFVLSQRSYLAPLAQSLKNMTARITELNSFQAEMAETVCHDIKTPLARLKLLSHMLRPEQLEQTKQDINDNLHEIEVNIYDYLRLAQNDYLQHELEYQAVPVVEFCQQLVQRFALFSTIPIHLDADQSVPVTLSADTLLLQRALNNLLSNALRFAKTSVQLQIRADDHCVCFCINDDGPGWQSGHTASGIELAHHGLGLSIVRRVASQHGGGLTFERSSSGGASCTLTLPLTPPQRS
ncbi:MAG: HAMP domain-containing histidine kinase [Rheinheimera sp.]|nr:MAG: HAMP domain-containing histidine kinase [Rheinheimera sp.]